MTKDNLWSKGFISAYTSTSQSIPEGSHGRKQGLKQTPWKKASLWLVPHDLHVRFSSFNFYLNMNFSVVWPAVDITQAWQTFILAHENCLHLLHSQCLYWHCRIPVVMFSLFMAVVAFFHWMFWKGVGFSAHQADPSSHYYLGRVVPLCIFDCLAPRSFLDSYLL